MTDDINKNGLPTVTTRQNTSLKSTGLCSCLWMDCESQLQLQQQHRITEFGRSAKLPRIPWNSAKIWKFRGNAKFRGSARNSATRGNLWSLLIIAANGQCIDYLDRSYSQ